MLVKSQDHPHLQAIQCSGTPCRTARSAKIDKVLKKAGSKRIQGSRAEVTLPMPALKDWETQRNCCQKILRAVCKGTRKERH